MAGRLKPLDVECEEKHGKYADGGGLYLIVAGPTPKNWSYRYWFKGKERWRGLGSSKNVYLKQARLLRDAARLQVRAGVDLVQEKRLPATRRKQRPRPRDTQPIADTPHNARKLGGGMRIARSHVSR